MLRPVKLRPGRHVRRRRLYAVLSKETHRQGVRPVSVPLSCLLYGSRALLGERWRGTCMRDASHPATPGAAPTFQNGAAVHPSVASGHSIIVHAAGRRARPLARSIGETSRSLADFVCDPTDHIGMGLRPADPVRARVFDFLNTLLLLSIYPDTSDRSGTHARTRFSYVTYE